MKPTLIVFVKEPRPGRVKTRLARDVGHVAAAQWYRRQCVSLLRRLGRDPRHVLHHRDRRVAARPVVESP
ncbi:MAG: hypothetical protein AAF968_19730, partial [Pseudomonadota bacterium]